MKWGWVALAAALTAGGLALRQPGPAPVARKPIAASDCQAIVFEGARFTECIAVPGRHRIETRLKGRNGVVYRSLDALAADVRDPKAAFATNGGMFDAQGLPIGYYVENGERLHPLNTRDGAGNFHLKPNGVFFGGADGRWQVLTSMDFAATVKKRPAFGTQSGPMLLIDGKVHPKFSQNGASLKLRNAVGVDAQGRAHFVITEEPVSFGALARMMRDSARTPNAVFLDGSVSSLWDPVMGRRDSFFPLGPLILVTKLDRR